MSGWIALAFLSAGVQVHAADAAVAGESAAEILNLGIEKSAGSAQLEEVVVTATKREENLSKVPISIAAMSQEAMLASGVKSIEGIAALVPGVTFDSGNGATNANIAIRGISAERGAATTGLYLDDTAIQARATGVSSFGYPRPLTFDVDRVEVARGPQGTLFGAGAAGGAIRFIMTEPSLREFSGFTHSEFASTERGGLSYETGIAGGGPLMDDRVGFRASVWYRHDGGYVDHVNPFTGATVESDSNYSDKVSARLALKLAVSDSVTISPSIYYQSTPNHDTSVLWLPLSSTSAGQLKNGSLFRQKEKGEFYLGTVKVEADLGSLALTAVTSYFYRTAFHPSDLTTLLGAFTFPGPDGWGDPRGPWYPTSYDNAVTQYETTGQNTVSQEIRVASSDPSAALSWVGGLYYSRSRQDDRSLLFGPSIGSSLDSPAYDNNVIATDTQYAAFGQADLKLGDHWKLTAGLRASRTRFDSETRSRGVLLSGAPTVNFGKLDETPITPKAGLSYQLNEDTLLYLSVAKGYRIGGVNNPLPTQCNVSSAPSAFNSDSVLSYELGAKTLLLDRRLQIDASAFHIKWHDIQTAAFLAACGFQYIDNTGGATSNGFDLAVRALLTDRLRVELAGSYAKSRFDETLISGGVLVVQKDDSIGALPQVPSPWNVTASVDYEYPLAGDAQLYGRAEDVYKSRNPGPFSSEHPGSYSYAPMLVANPSTNVVNLRVGIRWPRYDLALFVNNVTNSLPVLLQHQDIPSSPLFYGTTFRPRTIGVTGNWKF